MHPVLARRLKLAAYREQLLAQRYDPASLEAARTAIPKPIELLPEVALEGSASAERDRRGGSAAAVTKPALSASPRSEWDDTCTRLLDEYARALAFPARGTSSSALSAG